MDAESPEALGAEVLTISDAESLKTFGVEGLVELPGAGARAADDDGVPGATSTRPVSRTD